MTARRLILALGLGGALICGASADLAAQTRRPVVPHEDEWRRYEEDAERRQRADERAFEERQRAREERERREQWDELRRDNYRRHGEPPSTIIVVPPPAPVYRQPAPCQVMRPAYDYRGDYIGDVCVR